MKQTQNLVKNGLVLLSLIVAHTASAQDRVFVETDEQGRDSAIVAQIEAPADVQKLRAQFGNGIRLRDIGVSLEFKYVPGSQNQAPKYLVRYADFKNEYRQQFDEALKIFSIPEPLNEQLHIIWDLEETQRRCNGVQNCSHFSIKSFSTADGRLELSCKVRWNLNSPSTEPHRFGPYCQARFDIRDLTQ